MIKPFLLVETTYITKAYPSEIKKAASIVYNYLKENNLYAVIEKYGLEPFDIRVQSLSRTFIDKVFAICDYYLSGKIERNSRHIYDLSLLLEKVKVDDNLRQLVKEVRNERKLNKRCYSAQDNIDIPKILSEIVQSSIFHEDYKSITEIMMFQFVSYEEAIKSLSTIIETGLFDFKN